MSLLQDLKHKQFLYSSQYGFKVLVEYANKEQLRFTIMTETNEIKHAVFDIQQFIFAQNYYNLKLVRVIETSEIVQNVYSKKTLEELI